MEFFNLSQTLRKISGVFMVLGESVHVAGESMQACSSQNAGLPHAAAQDLAPPPRLVDNVPGPAKNRAHRRAKTL